MTEQTTIATTAAAVLADLEELQSRGFGHPDGALIVGRIKVGLQQVADLAAAPPPPADPVDVAVAKLSDQVQAVADQVESLQVALHAAIDGKP